MTKEKILIGICTYNRPQMLKECLQSLAKQELIENTELTFCIADNNSNSEYNIQEVVHKTLNGLDYKYILVEKRGISFARNAIVECANENNADFIAFIDDDEYAEANWIKNLYTKISGTGVDVVQGKVINILPENTPPLIQKAWVTNHDEDTILKHVGTNNVIFRSKLIRKWSLRFNEKLALTGGEDLDFFLKSRSLGGKHIFTNTAIVYETVPEARSTLKWQLHRKMQDGYAVSYVMYLNYGKWFVFRKYIVKSIKNIITAPFYILAGAIATNENLKFKGLQKLFHAFGCLAFTCNIKIRSYNVVTGN